MAVTLTAEMKSVVNNNQCYVATVTPEGKPSIGPKGSTRVWDDGSLIFAEATGRGTLANLKQAPYVAVAAVDMQSYTGFRLVGTAEVLESGTIYEAVKQEREADGKVKPKAVIKVTVEEVYSLSPREAGKRLL